MYDFDTGEKFKTLQPIPLKSVMNSFAFVPILIFKKLQMRFIHAYHSI